MCQGSCCCSGCLSNRGQEPGSTHTTTFTLMPNFIYLRVDRRIDIHIPFYIYIYIYIYDYYKVFERRREEGMKEKEIGFLFFSLGIGQTSKKVL